MKLGNFKNNKQWFTPTEAFMVLGCSKEKFDGFIDSYDLTLVHRSLKQGTGYYISRHEIERILRLGF